MRGELKGIVRSLLKYYYLFICRKSFLKRNARRARTLMHEEAFVHEVCGSYLLLTCILTVLVGSLESPRHALLPPDLVQSGVRDVVWQEDQ